MDSADSSKAAAQSADYAFRLDALSRALAEANSRLGRAEAELRALREGVGGGGGGEKSMEATADAAAARASARATNFPEADPLLMTGARNLDSILARLRILEAEAGTDGATGSGGGPAVGDPGAAGALSPAGFAALTLSGRTEALRLAACAFLNAEIECEDGDVVLNIDVPEGLCG